MNEYLEELQLAFEDDSQTIDQVCAEFETTTGTLYRYAKAGNWRKRRQKPREPVARQTRPSSSLQTLIKMRKVAQYFVSELDDELNSQQDDRSSSERERGIRSLRMLLKVTEDITRLEDHFAKISAGEDKKEIDSKQRQNLARRIQALRGRN